MSTYAIVAGASVVLYYLFKPQTHPEPSTTAGTTDRVDAHRNVPSADPYAAGTLHDRAQSMKELADANKMLAGVRKRIRKPKYKKKPLPGFLRMQANINPAFRIGQHTIKGNTNIPGFLRLKDRVDPFLRVPVDFRG